MHTSVGRSVLLVNKIGILLMSKQIQFVKFDVLVKELQSSLSMHTSVGRSVFVNKIGIL